MEKSLQPSLIFFSCPSDFSVLLSIVLKSPTKQGWGGNTDRFYNCIAKKVDSLYASLHLWNLSFFFFSPIGWRFVLMGTTSLYQSPLYAWSHLLLFHQQIRYQTRINHLANVDTNSLLASRNRKSNHKKHMHIESICY